ncbi:MAG: hypothetical protein ACRDWY_09285 [Actinomycetes bacterium]
MVTALPSRSSRSERGVVVVAACAVALAMSNVGSAANAAPAAPPTHLGVSVASNLADVPQTSGTPALLVEALKDVPVTVTLLDAADQPVVVSNSKATVVSLAVSGGLGFVGAAQVVIPGGVSSGVGTAKLDRTGNDVTISGEVVRGVKEALGLTGVSPDFDVVRDRAQFTYDVFPGNNVLVSEDGKDTECTPTKTDKTCADLILPNGIASNAFFATGACDAAAGCESTKELLLVLAEFGAGHSNQTPATLIVKCDKSLCPGGGIQTYTLQVNLAGDGALPSQPAPSCAAKGVIQDGLDFCVDYVQSKRDNSGDSHLYLLLARDARASCC